MNKKHIFIGLALVIIPAILLVSEHLYLSHARSVKQVVVNHSDVSSVELWHGDDKVQSNIADGTSLSIKLLDTNYELRYTGNQGFSDGKIDIPKYAERVSITPSYSDEVLAKTYSKEKSAIVGVLRSAYPDSEELYDIKNDRLYQRGDWFGATLEYKGNSYFGRDSLGLIMQKVDGRWKLITDPPMPSVNIHTYPGTPMSVLDAVNSQLFS